YDRKGWATSALGQKRTHGRLRLSAEECHTYLCERSLRVLCACCERPRGRATEKCDELAPSHCLPEALDRPSYRFKRSSLRDASMSALGQKQTFAVQNGMSAFPLRAKSGRSNHARQPVRTIVFKFI